jgi:hypothetical protein
MNKKIHILEFVDELKETYLCYVSLLIHPHPLVWISFYSSTTTGIVLFLFICNLWYSNKKRPIPEVVDEWKENYTRGYR